VKCITNAQLKLGGGRSHTMILLGIPLLLMILAYLLAWVELAVAVVASVTMWAVLSIVEKRQVD
jgi:hypothetical protein